MPNTICSAEPDKSSPPVDDAQLIANGYEPVPAVGKRPIIDGWQSGPMPVERIRALREAHADHTNTGLRTGQVAAIDIDLHNPGHAAQISSLASCTLDFGPPRRVGSKGEMLIYRNETPVEKIIISDQFGWTNPRGGAHLAGTIQEPQSRPKRRTLVEILGQGQQFIAYGIHPDTGKPYRWIDTEAVGEPLTVKRTDLPQVTPTQLRAFAAAAAGILTKLGYVDVRISDRGTYAAAREAKRREYKVPVTREELIEILGYLDPGVVRGGSGGWISRLGSIQATPLRDVAEKDMDGELIEIAQNWSRGEYWDGGCPANWADDDDVEITYNTLDPMKAGGSTFGSLWHAARDNGYTKGPPQPTVQETFGRHFAEQGIGPVDGTKLPKTEDGGGDKVVLLCGADVEPKKIDWLWSGHYAHGKFHVLAGKPEAGKNLITISTAAILSVGGTWPDGTKAPTGDTIIWSGEDDFEDTTLPRFIAAGGDPHRFHCVRDIKTADGGKRRFDPATDVPALCEMIRRMPEVRYLIIDPVSVVVASGNGASNNNAQSRRALAPLVALAEERGIVVEGITHFAKDSDRRSVLERVIESTAFTAVARIVHVAHRFEEDDDRPRRWVRAKGNIVKRGSGSVVGYEYELEDTPLRDYPDISAPRLKWGNPLRGEVSALIAADQEPGAKEQAVAFLKARLMAAAEVGVPTQDLAKEAQARCISWTTIKRAKQGLPIEVVKGVGAFSSSWNWVWAGTAETANEMVGEDDADSPF